MSVVFTLLLLCSVLMSCSGKSNGFRQGMNEEDFTLSSISALDRNGREITPMGTQKTDQERYVGVFYWLWMSNSHYYYHGIYDTTKLMSTPEGEEAFWNIDPSRTDLQELSPNGAFHWTNEPLYGYYNSSDPWVITRHMELFIMAGIDYIFLDTSNAYQYEFDTTDPGRFDGTLKSPTYTLLDTMLALYNLGWDVPKVVFLTNTKSGERVDNIYKYFYQSGKYEELWFKPDGKPMIIGTTEQNNGASDTWGTANFVPISATMQEYFDVKDIQWPNQADEPNGFPWLSWYYPQTYHVETQAISVSVAQHGASSGNFTGMDPQSNRGYDYRTGTVEEKWQEGKNFENQWQAVFDNEERGNHVRFVQVTGWNEWIGMKFDNLAEKAVMVDQFYGPYTRDIEMDKTLYQDDTYLQLVRNIRKFKMNEAADEYDWPESTISSVSDFDGVEAVYTDFAGDATARDFWSFDVRRGQPRYTDTTNRNDIVETRVAHDKENLYFYVETKEDITAYESGDNWMNILIKTGNSTAEGSFEGYDYIINRSPKGDKTSVERSNGGWNWESSGEAEIMVEGNRMMVTVPLSALGMANGEVQFEFKVADNVSKPSHFTEEDAEHSIMHYYVTGDSAPIGRLNYSYGY